MAYIMFFFVAFGIGAIGFSASTAMTIIGIISFIAGLMIAIFGAEDDANG